LLKQGIKKLVVNYKDLEYAIFHTSNCNPQDENVLVIGESYHSTEFEKAVPPETLAKAKRFIREEDSLAYLSRHHSLNLVLSKWLDCNPNSILFERNDFGKPFLAKIPFYFNCSKSGNLFCMLFSNVDCGVDIEVIRDVSAMKVVAELHFHPTEKEYCETGKFNERFLTIWTRKEALLKAVGTGLIDELSNINTLKESIELNNLSYQIITEKNQLFIVSACFQKTSNFSILKFKL
jgi:phosphopantetheinyl transferase